MRLRPHCSQAAITTFCQCARRFSARSPFGRATERAASTGCTSATPSSTALRSVLSIFSPADTPCTSVTRSGDSRSIARCWSRSIEIFRRCIEAMRAANSPPRPLNSVMSSPSRRRSTWIAWCAASSDDARRPRAAARRGRTGGPCRDSGMAPRSEIQRRGGAEAATATAAPACHAHADALAGGRTRRRLAHLGHYAPYAGPDRYTGRCCGAAPGRYGLVGRADAFHPLLRTVSDSACSSCCASCRP